MKFRLPSEAGSDSETLGTLIDYQRKYKIFAPFVVDIKQKIAGANEQDVRKIPGYLNQGDASYVFSISLGGHEFAVKIFKDKDFSGNKFGPISINDDISPLLKVKNLENVCQLESFSLGDRVVITKLLPGTPMNRAEVYHSPKEEGSMKITEDHLVKLINMVMEMYHRGVVCDYHNAGNFLFDPVKGISMLDFSLNRSSSEYTLARSVYELYVCLANCAYDEESSLPSAQTAVRELVVIVKKTFPVIYKQMEKDNYVKGRLAFYHVI